jgi:hypothetical protein
VIYNWKQADTVAIDATPFLSKGQEFALLNPEDVYGKPVLRGRRDGPEIAVPLDGEFAVFVVLKDVADTR